jgi:hypothetical protein
MEPPNSEEARQLSAKASWQADEFARLIPEEIGGLPPVAVKALVAAIDGLRLAVLATIPETPDAEARKEPARWARVELFGHQVRYGLIREREMYGRRFVEIFQPNVYGPLDENGDARLLAPSEQRFVHPNAIYAIYPLEQDAALAELLREATEIPF